MLPMETDRYKQLLELARKQFDANLLPIEEQVLRHSVLSQEDGVAAVETTRPLLGWDGPKLRGSFLRWLAVDKEAQALLDPMGIRVFGVRLCDPLDLYNCDVYCSMQFSYCLIETSIIVTDAKLNKLRITDCTLDSRSVEDGVIEANGLRMSGSLLLWNLDITGRINLEGARIDGMLFVRNTNFNTQDQPLSLRYAVIRGNLTLSPDVSSAGCFDLQGIHIDGELDLSNACVNSDTTINLASSEIHGSVLFTRIISEGKVNLTGAKITAKLDCSSSNIQSFVCRGMQADDLIWRNMTLSKSATLDLSTASLKWLHDDLASWPANGNLKVDGFVCDEFSPLSRDRTEWLERQSENDRIAPQPWMHLAKHFREKGFTDEAKHAVYLLRKYQLSSQRSHGDKALQGQGKSYWRQAKGNVRYAWGLILSRLEEKPQRIFISLIALWLLGTLEFSILASRFSETADGPYKISHSWQQPSDAHTAGASPKFVPVIYALENSLPVLRLGQDDHWAPDIRSCCGQMYLYWVMAWSRWFLIVAGWVQGIVLATALTSRFRS